MSESAAATKAKAEVTPSATPEKNRQARSWDSVLGLRCELSIEVPLPGFKVYDLSRLRPQMVIASQWRVGDDVPLRVNGQLIAWSEFEVVRGRLAVRITELR
jgi:flagellar motor switch/type III secretory pathway protein FliN